MNIRTDIAAEHFPQGDALPDDIHREVRRGIFEITQITIDNDNYISSLGKPKGRYITLDGIRLSSFSDDYSQMAIELADELRPLIPEGEILVVGLGNTDITPDAVGPQVIAKTLATRHLRGELDGNEEKFLTSLRPVSCFAGGVLGQTGIESAEIVHALCKEIKPSAVIAVDALACSDISRLGTTIQISDSGISPGSGVANSRKELSENTLGLPVIAVGVPTVVDMHTIVRSLTGSEVPENTPNMMVTPRDVDRLAERSSQLIAFGINLALHPQLTFDEVRSLF